MQTLLKETVFSVGEVTYDWADVLLAARLRGDLARLEQEVRAGIASLKLLESSAAQLDEEVGSAASDFRYERDLVSGEVMETWLARRELDVEAWMEFLRRSVARRRSGEPPETILARYPVGDDEIEEALPAEGFCAGHFARFAYDLAGRAAVGDRLKEESDRAAADRDDTDGIPTTTGELAHGDFTGLSPEELGRRLGVHRGLEAAFERFRHAAVTPKSIKEHIAANHLEWIRVDCRSASFPDEQGAREAALCIREDGLELTEVAADARVAVREASLYLGELEPALRDCLLAARKDELLGPLKLDGQAALFLVLDKTLPSAEDPELRRRAERAILERTIDREIDERVRWHFQF